MDNNRNSSKGGQQDPNADRLESRSSKPGDLPDLKKDREELQNEETFINLPDVKDIPGQEFVHVPGIGEMEDTTISSDDEEGVGVFDLDDSEDLTPGTEADVSRDEKITLANTDYMPTRDENNLVQARMDNVDFDNEALNEKGFGDIRSASDLDVPGAEMDDRNENIGEEDEENNDYSLGSEDENLAEGRS